MGWHGGVGAWCRGWGLGMRERSGGEGRGGVGSGGTGSEGRLNAVITFHSGLFWCQHVSIGLCVSRAYLWRRRWDVSLRELM